MRTTVNIDDEVLRRARAAAVQHGRSLGDVVDDALRVWLLRDAPDRPAAVALPTYGSAGLQPGVDLEDKDALAAILGDETAASAAR